MNDIVQWIALIILLLLSAFFSCSETALTTVNKIKVRALADEGNSRAKKLMKVHERWAKMLSAVLIGNNIVNIAASALATLIAVRINLSVGIMTLLLTLIVLIFGEIMPKNIAAAYAEKISLAVVDIIWVLMTVLTPVILIVDGISGTIMKVLGIDLNNGDKLMTESELRTIVDVSHEDGVIESNERKMINNVFDFGDSRARDIMIPRIDVSEVSISATYEEVKEIFSRDKYTRFPVYAKDTDNVVGIINMKDFFLADPLNFRVRDLMREAYYTYEGRHTSDLLMDIKRESVTMAVVLNEYGASVGIVTMEDLLEEIVGEIRDEYDEDEIDMIRRMSDNAYEADGSVKLDDLNDAIGTSLSSEDYDSLGGYLIGKLDHLPVDGESVTTEDGITLEAMQVSKNRVNRVHITLPENFFENKESSRNNLNDFHPQMPTTKAFADGKRGSYFAAVPKEKDDQRE